MKKIFIPTLAFLLLTVGDPKVLNEDLLNVNPIVKKFYDFNYDFSADYLSKISFSKNFNLNFGKSLQIILPPKTMLNLDKGILDLNPTILKSVRYPKEKPMVFEKFSYIYNNSPLEDTLRFSYTKDSVLTISTKRSLVRNGPFTIFPTSNGLEVKSSYGKYDVVPMKVFNGKENIEVKDEKNYPPYYVSSEFTNKDSISSKDVQKILNSYVHLYGDYFRVNHKALVCTDVATLVMKTVGIDYGKELTKYHVFGNDYRQRNISVFKNFLKKRGIYDENIYYFMGRNLERIISSPGYDKLTPENFGMDNFSPGELLFFTRAYATGPLRKSLQREDVHFGIISEVKDNKIKESIMTTSSMRKAPYDKNISLSKVNFQKWYKFRSKYTGSDETNETLTYRVYGIFDLVSAINSLKTKPN